MKRCHPWGEGAVLVMCSGALYVIYPQQADAVDSNRVWAGDESFPSPGGGEGVGGG